METTYGVELTGNGLNTLNSIANTVNKLLQLNPLDRTISNAKKLTISSVTAEQEKALKADIKEMLELAKVGKGNLTELAQLTTYGQKQNLIGSMVELMGGTSQFKATQAAVSAVEQSFGNIGYEQNEILEGISEYVKWQNGTTKLILHPFDSMKTMSEYSEVADGVLSFADGIASIADVISSIKTAGMGASSSYAWGHTIRSEAARGSICIPCEGIQLRSLTILLGIRSDVQSPLFRP